MDSRALPFTGERFTPETRGAIWYEHWHRYCAVLPIAAGREVLDAACGEGYGSAFLAGGAASVTGVDLSTAAIAHAQSRYTARRNLKFVAGAVTSLPFADASFDVVVSFETIEHLAPQAEMMAEFRRVLRPDGLMVISSPNRPVYASLPGTTNEFHVRELDRAELAALLAPGFPRQRWYGQRVASLSLVWSSDTVAADVRFLSFDGTRVSGLADPVPAMYWIVICGGPEAELPALPLVSSFDDGRQSLSREHAEHAENAKAQAFELADARKIAQERLTESVARMHELFRQLDEVKVALDHARSGETAARARLAIVDAEIRDLHQARRDVEARLARRETLIGWLRWPAHRAWRWWAERRR